MLQAGRPGKKKKKRKGNNKAKRSKGQRGNAKSAKHGTQLAGASGGAGVRGAPRSLKGSSTALVGAGAHTALDEVRCISRSMNRKVALPSSRFRSCLSSSPIVSSYVMTQASPVGGLI